MKICYLILAHNNVRHFGSLLNAIIAANVEIQIHIDKKVSILPFQDALKHLDIENDNVKFISDRVAINWGGWSMVQAMINLLRTALLSDFNAERFVLISGVDYPVKSPAFISQFFQKYSDFEFIDLVDLNRLEVERPLSRITTYNIESFGKKNLYIARILYMLGIKRQYKKYLDSLHLFAGSQWWALSRKCAEFVVDFVDDNHRLVKFFHHVFIPDESFFHTIIGNSKFRPKVVGNLTFIDWSRPVPPYPATIDQTHVESMSLGHCFPEGRDFLFARKFHDDSNSLTKLIRENVWVGKQNDNI